MSLSSHELAALLMEMPDQPVVMTDNADTVIGAIVDIVTDYTFDPEGVNSPCITLETTE